MAHWLCTCLSLEYFILSWFVLLTEIKLFDNYYYKFLMGSSLGTVERFLFHARLLPMTYLFYFFVCKISVTAQISILMDVLLFGTVCFPWSFSFSLIDL